MLHVQLATCHGDGGGIGFAGAPLARRARSRLLHHLVDLLERQTLGSWLETVSNVWSEERGTYLCLGDKEIGVHERARTKTAPDEENRRTQVSLIGVDHVRGDNGDDLSPVSKVVRHPGGRSTHRVPQPVRGSGQANTTGSYWKREDFTNQNLYLVSSGALESHQVVCLPMHRDPTWKQRRR